MSANGLRSSVVAAVVVGLLALAWSLRPHGATPPYAPDPKRTTAAQEAASTLPDRPLAADRTAAADPTPTPQPPATSARTPPDPAHTDLDRPVIRHHPPLDDAETWQQERARVALALQERQVAATRAFAATHHLDEAATAELVAAVQALHAELRGLKQQVELGAIEPEALREATPVLRAACEARVRLVVGDLTPALADHLAAGEPGGGF